MRCHSAMQSFGPQNRSRRDTPSPSPCPPAASSPPLSRFSAPANGTWVAHGGDTDAAAVDAHDRLKVPREEPRYTLRRVWLSREQEEGYYYGFADEGL